MKQFNLEEYLKNPLKRVVTRDGRNARIICTDAMGQYLIIALVEAPNHAGETAYSYTKDGHFNQFEEHSYDLFFAQEKHERWVNLYKEGDNIYASMDTFKTKEEAEALNCSSCIATVKIEWEE